jgi:myotubularin-related protein 5/13
VFILLGYDCMAKSHLDVTSKLLRDIEQLEMELGYLPHRWQHHWERLEPPPAQPPPPPPQEAAPPPVKVTTPSMYAREYSRNMHKRSTIELLLRGKVGVSASGGSDVGGAVSGSGGAFAHPHRFEKFNYPTPTPTYCDVCNSLLWGIVRTGYRCQVRVQTIKVRNLVQV